MEKINSINNFMILKLNNFNIFRKKLLIKLLNYSNI